MWKSKSKHNIFFILLPSVCSYDWILFQRRSLKSYDLNLKNIVVSGSCNKDDISMISSSKGTSLKVTISNYYAQTDRGLMVDKKSCNLAIPLTLEKGKQIGLYQMEYKGYTWIPRQTGSSTEFNIDYYFSGIKGRTIEKEFHHEEDIFVSENVPTIWSSCGGSTTFEINSSIYAKKTHDDHLDSYIKINSSESISLAYWFYERSCS